MFKGYLPTAKNGMVAGLYLSPGFSEIPSAPDASPGTTMWRISTDNLPPPASAITIAPPV